MFGATACGQSATASNAVRCGSRRGFLGEQLVEERADGRRRVGTDEAAEELEMLGQLRVGVQAGAGVVEVDVAASVETGEVASAEIVEGSGAGVRGIRTPERGLDLL
jgi:hypothetical protein